MGDELELAGGVPLAILGINAILFYLEMNNYPQVEIQTNNLS